MITYSPLQRHLVDSRSDKGNSGCRNVNNNNEYKGCILMNLTTYYVRSMQPRGENKRGVSDSAFLPNSFGLW